MAANQRSFETREHHLAVMEKAMLAGRSVAEVVAAAVTTFGVHKMTAYRDVLHIRQCWKLDERKALDVEFGKALARRDLLFRRAINAADDAAADGRHEDERRALRLALEIEIDACELLGLYPN